MLKSQLVFTHLGKDGTDVQVDVTWVRDLQTVVNCLFTEMQIVVLDLKSLFKIGESASKFLCTSENACKVIVRYGTVSVAFFRETNCLMEQFQRNLEVFCFD